MSAGVSLWVRTGVTTGVSLVLLLSLTPSRPPARIAWPAAVAAGVCAGPLLYIAAARRWPRLARRNGSVPVLMARQAFLGLWAASEEIVWRRVLLGELLMGGALAALALSSIAFSLAHRARRRLHLATGASFGVLYLGTGVLLASIAAHWVYNALVGASVDRPPSRRSASL